MHVLLLQFTTCSLASLLTYLLTWTYETVLHDENMTSTRESLKRVREYGGTTKMIQLESSIILCELCTSNGKKSTVVNFLKK